MNIPFTGTEVKPFWRRNRKGRFFLINRHNRKKKRKGRSYRKIAEGWTGRILQKDLFSVRKEYKKIYALNPFKEGVTKKVQREYEIQKKLGKKRIAPRVRGRGKKYFDMELLRGKTLEDAVAKNSSRKQKRYARRLANKMRRMHDTGVIHNDLHHKNVFILGGDRVRIIDYGSAKDKSRPLTMKERRRDTNRILNSAGKGMPKQQRQVFNEEFRKEYMR